MSLDEVLSAMFEPLPPRDATRRLPDGRVAVIQRLTFGRARLSVGLAGEQWFEDEW